MSRYGGPPGPPHAYPPPSAAPGYGRGPPGPPMPHAGPPHAPSAYPYPPHAHAQGPPPSNYPPPARDDRRYDDRRDDRQRDARYDERRPTTPRDGPGAGAGYGPPPTGRSNGYDPRPPYPNAPPSAPVPVPAAAPPSSRSPPRQQYATREPYNPSAPSAAYPHNMRQPPASSQPQAVAPPKANPGVIGTKRPSHVLDTPSAPATSSPSLFSSPQQAQTSSSSATAQQPFKRQRSLFNEGPPEPLLELRKEMTNLVNAAPQTKLAPAAVATVVGSIRVLVDDLAPAFVDATCEAVTHHLGLTTQQLGMFKHRVTSQLSADLITFLTTKYSTELEHLLLASTTGQTQPQNMLLGTKLMTIVAHADRTALLAMKEELQKPVTSTTTTTTTTATTTTPVAATSNAQNEITLINAALNGDLAQVQAMIRAGTNINAARDGGWTSLMNATLQGHLPIVQYLLSMQADVNIRDHHGFTALMYAANYGRYEIAEMIARAGADMTATDHTNRTVYDYIANDAAMRAAIDRGVAARAATAAPTPAAPVPNGMMQPMPMALPVPPTGHPNLMAAYPQPVMTAPIGYAPATPYAAPAAVAYPATGAPSAYAPPTGAPAAAAYAAYPARR